MSKKMIQAFLWFQTSKRMRILFFDTETNGLPWNRYASYRNTDNWPHVVQFAWQVWDFSDLEHPVRLQEVNTLIRPRPEMKWSAEAAAIHKISLESAVRDGVEIQTALDWFREDCVSANYVIAHNLQFDKTVILSEVMRLHQTVKYPDPENWWPTKKEQDLCTMKIATPLCAILAKKGTPEDPYKWPTLAELFAWLFPKTPLPTNLHDASADVECLVKCVQEMLRRRLLVLETPPLARQPDRFVDLLRSLFRWIA